jgi:NAD(P)-dependent dehydrogenase (short-subunit alcohol dehydrogenase family)
VTLRFDGRVAVVSGAGRGLGRAHALALAARGASVVVNDLPARAGGSIADEVAREIVLAGGQAIAAPGDLTDPDAASAVVARARKAFGPVDTLVNNAGVADLLPFDGPLDAFRRVVDVNLFGTVNLTHAAWPDLAACGSGRVVMTTSAIGMWGGPQQSAYAASKAALVGLVKALALEGAAQGVTVNAVAPAAQTRLTDARFTKVSRTWRPELVSPVALALAHPACTANGVVLSAFSGLVARIEAVQARGHRFDPRQDLSVDDVWERLEELCALDDPIAFADGHLDALSRPLEPRSTHA